jgi:hypothetical protein
MKYALKACVAALALVVAAPASAALTPSGTDCNTVITGQGFVDCSGLYEGNLFNEANEADLNLALEVLLGTNPEIEFGDIDPTKTFFTADGDMAVLFGEALTGEYILGLKFADESGLFLFDFVDQAGLEFNINGFSSGVVINPPGEVPEPATWAMMLMGFGAAGYAMRRRRRIGPIAQLA